MISAHSSIEITVYIVDEQKLDGQIKVENKNLDLSLLKKHPHAPQTGAMLSQHSEKKHC